jgi:hypothetical protein
MIKWNATMEEMELISKIRDRARTDGFDGDGMQFAMDLEACHSNGCPLDFKGILEADSFNFWHDIGGIMANIDRTTGELTNCFIPRFAKH